MLHNLASQLQNASKSLLRQTSVPFSKNNKQVLDILCAQGLVQSYSVGDRMGPYAPRITRNSVADARLWVDFKYRGTPVLTSVKCVSKPSRRVVMSPHELELVAQMKGKLKSTVGKVIIVKTAYGLLELHDCLRKGVGGMVLLTAN